MLDSPTATFGAMEVINNPVTLDLNALRAHRTDDGEHLWVIGILYQVDDPEIALDSMTLGAHNLIGTRPIACLRCQEPYVSRTVPGPACWTG